MSELVQFLRGVCLPAKIYLALIVVNFVSMLLVKKYKHKTDLNFTIMIIAFFICTLVGLAVTWFGNYLCSHGYEVVTWLLIILPLFNLFRNLRNIIKG